MKCPMESEENRDLLLEYGTGTRSPASAAFERHLEDCAACQGFVAGRRTVWAALLLRVDSSRHISARSDVVPILHQHR